jgi:hypothetical protein
MVVSLELMFVNLYGKAGGCAIPKGEIGSGKGFPPGPRKRKLKK